MKIRDLKVEVAQVGNVKKLYVEMVFQGNGETPEDIFMGTIKLNRKDEWEFHPEYPIKERESKSILYTQEEIKALRKFVVDKQKEILKMAQEINPEIQEIKYPDYILQEGEQFQEKNIDLS